MGSSSKYSIYSEAYSVDLLAATYITIDAEWTTFVQTLSLHGMDIDLIAVPKHFIFCKHADCSIIQCKALSEELCCKYEE